MEYATHLRARAPILLALLVCAFAVNVAFSTPSYTVLSDSFDGTHHAEIGRAPQRECQPTDAGDAGRIDPLRTRLRVHALFDVVSCADLQPAATAGPALHFATDAAPVVELIQTQPGRASPA